MKAPRIPDAPGGVSFPCAIPRAAGAAFTDDAPTTPGALFVARAVVADCAERLASELPFAGPFALGDREWLAQFVARASHL